MASTGGRASGSRILSSAALALAVLALVVAGYATVQAHNAVDAASARPAPTGGTAETSPVAATNSPAGAATSPTDVGSSTTNVATDTSTEPEPTGSQPLPTVGYVPSYPEVKLRLTPNGYCDTSRLVDLDRAEVTTDQNAADVTFYPCQNSNRGDAFLMFPSPNVATAGSTAATPEDCANAIIRSPSSQKVPLNRGLVLCATTDGVSRPSDPTHPRMIRIVVDSIGQDGATDLTVTAWEIPR